MINMRQSMRQLAALQVGGLQVITLLDGTTVIPESETTYLGKRFDDKGIRTVIQPDMDVMTMVSPEAFVIDGLWEQHTAVIEHKLSIIYTLQRWIQQSWRLFMIIPSSLFLYDLFTVEFPDTWFVLMRSGIIAFIVYLSRRWIKHGTSWAIRRYLRAQLGKYLGSA